MEQLYYEKVNKALDNLILRADKVNKFIGFSESPSTPQRDKGKLFINLEDGLGNYKALPFSLPALEIIFEGEGSTFKELIEAVKVKYEKRALYYYLKEEETESEKMYKEVISGVKEESTISKESEEFLEGDSFQILKYLFLNQTLTSIGGAKGKVTNITKGERDYRIWIEEIGQGESVSHPLKSVRNQFELTNVQEVTLNKIIGGMDVMKEEVKITALEEDYSQMDYKEVFSKVDLSRQALKLPDNIYVNYNRKILLLI